MYLSAVFLSPFISPHLFQFIYFALSHPILHFSVSPYLAFVSPYLAFLLLLSLCLTSSLSRHYTMGLFMYRHESFCFPFCLPHSLLRFLSLSLALFQVLFIFKVLGFQNVFPLSFLFFVSIVVLLCTFTIAFAFNFTRIHFHSLSRVLFLDLLYFV